MKFSVRVEVDVNEDDYPLVHEELASYLAEVAARALREQGATVLHRASVTRRQQ